MIPEPHESPDGFARAQAQGRHTALPLASALDGRRTAAVLAAFGVVVVLELASVLHHGLGFGGAGLDSFFSNWVANIVEGGSAALCLARATAVPSERRAWALLGGSLALWTAGSVYYSIALASLASPPFPSLSDAAWLGYYPLAYIAFGLLVRSRITRFHPSMWLDGVVAATSMAAVSATFVLPTVLRDLGGSFADVATNVAYPLGDALLIGMVVLSLGLSGWRPDRGRMLLGGGLAVLAAADTWYLFQIASGSYASGTLLDDLWPIGFLLVAGAAWQRTTVTDPVPLSGSPLLVVPASALASALCVFVVGDPQRSPYGVLLAAAALVLAFTRLALTVRESEALTVVRAAARTDELTGLLNRRGFYQHLEKLVGPAGCRSVALVLLDLDRFKEVNDSLGHAVGDTLLREVAPRLERALRAGDVVARLGGDEFALLLPDAGSDEALMVARRLLDGLRSPFEIDALSIHTDASVGISIWPDHAGDESDLVACADVAMYVAKDSRTEIEMYQRERDEAAHDRLRTVAALRSAIEGDGLVLHFQPEVHARDGEINAIEALVRWHDDDRGLVPPGDFLPLAEQAGLMPALTDRVLDLALTQCSRWRAAGELAPVAVNITSASLRDRRFPDSVTAALERHGVPAGGLILEITEDSLIDDHQRCLEILNRLQSAGVQIALDDYGTGRSSLAYLRELPIDILKLDRGFIAGITSDQRSAAIVRSAIDLSHALGFPITAEGVETVDALDALARYGCDTIQGYLISPPIPGRDLERWIAASDRSVSRAA